MTLLETALELHRNGISIVPVKTDGTKAPAVAWKPYTSTRADETQLRTWFEHDTFGLGLVTGTISGRLELTEIEGRAMDRLPELVDLANNSGAGDLWRRIATGWAEVSPSGGMHFFYRVDGDVPGNTKLASDPDRVTLAETRGEGGFVVVAPTGGQAHPTGKPWMLLTGGPATMPTLTLDERETLHAIIGTLDQTPPPAVHVALDAKWTSAAPKREGDVTPGDDFEDRTDWADILTPHGWTLVHARGRERFWCRPGKKMGISASTGHADDRDRLYVFTSSTSFDPETPYTKFGAYAHLNHADDHSQAAGALSTQGFGFRAERHLAPVAAPGSSSTASPTAPPAAMSVAAPSIGQLTGVETDGQLAAVTILQPRATVLNSSALALTDSGNADLLVARHAHHLKFVPEHANFIQWDGTRWHQQVDGSAALAAARETIDAIPTEGSESLARWKKKSLSKGALDATVYLARHAAEMRIPADELDARPLELNTPNGIVNLRTGRLTPSDPTRLHTKLTTSPYDPDQPTPRWDRFLATSLGNDDALIKYVQILVGISALGVVTAHVLPFLFGPGGNGKTAFLDTVIGVLGDYSMQAPPNFLLAGRTAHETEIARLQGRRLVIASEVNADSKFDEAKVKMLTGGDRISARFMHQNYFEFNPTHTLWLMGNHKPKVSAGGASFWRRLRLIPFTAEIPDSEKVEDLQNLMLTEEGAGILAWIVQGAMMAGTQTLVEPARVTQATAEYEREEDHLGRFIDERVKIGGGDLARVDSAEMRKAYSTWCREEGELEMNATAFGRDLRAKYDIEVVRSHGRRFYTNVVLYAPEDVDPTDVRKPDWKDR
jgi:putative DNA primase/helicase